jgi:hypothetical protein
MPHAMNVLRAKNLSAASGTLAPFHRLVSWWRSHDFDERYLAEATDHADLERRQRSLERTSVGPALETFNH